MMSRGGRSVKFKINTSLNFLKKFVLDSCDGEMGRGNGGDFGNGSSNFRTFPKGLSAPLLFNVRNKFTLPLLFSTPAMFLLGKSSPAHPFKLPNYSIGS